MKIENRPLSELRVGDTAEIKRLITTDDLYVFATASGNHNPMHLPNEDGDGDGHPEAVAPGMFVASLISAVLGMKLPGPGTLYRKQSLTFLDRAHAGDELVTRVTVSGVADDGTVTLETLVHRVSDAALILEGTAQVAAPREKRIFDGFDMPGLVVQRHRHFEALLERARPLPALVTAVVAPEEANSLGGAVKAAQEGIITPILIGDPVKIAATAKEIGADISGYELVAQPDHSAAAQVACDLVNAGRAAAVMKGHLHTDDLLRPMLDKANGLRAGRRFTHVFVMDVPGLDHPILVTDAAINIAPDLATKVDIVQNAIDLAISIGIELPRVGVLSAVETVNPAIPSSIDAALLSKMADRGQIKGGLVDGPLAMDNAVDIAAARTKGITSEVAGRADVLVVPGLDAGNMLAKQLAYLSHAEGAGLVLGAKVPVILNSRSDSPMSRLASCAVAALHCARINGRQAELLQQAAE
jgi:phosphate butyryltransferase